MMDCQRWRVKINVTTAIFCEVLLQYSFCFVLCIHLVPSCNSLLMFVSNFSVYLITILMYLFTFFYSFYLFYFTYSVNKNLDFITHLFIYSLFVNLQSVKTRISLSIYIHIYLFIHLHELSYIYSHIICIFFLLVSSIFSCFHWMKCRFVQTHPLGGQRWTKICLSVSESSGIRSKKKGSISREVNLVLYNNIFCYL